MADADATAMVSPWRKKRPLHGATGSLPLLGLKLTFRIERIKRPCAQKGLLSHGLTLCKCSIPMQAPGEPPPAHGVVVDPTGLPDFSSDQKKRKLWERFLNQHALDEQEDADEAVQLSLHDFKDMTPGAPVCTPSMTVPVHWSMAI